MSTALLSSCRFAVCTPAIVDALAGCRWSGPFDSQPAAERAMIPITWNDGRVCKNSRRRQRFQEQISGLVVVAKTASVLRQ